MNLKKIDRFLRTREEMSKIYNKLHKENFEYPYFFDISNGKQYLYFIGAHHTSNPQDPQVAKMLEWWRNFLEQTNGKNAIVLVEGSLRPVEKDMADAITRHGEAGLMTFIANKEQIEVLSPEPNHKKEVDLVTKKFGKEKAIYYYFARTVYQWQKHARKTTEFDSYVNIYLKSYEKLLAWEGFGFSIENMIKLHNKFHKHKFDLDNEKCFYKDSSPENDVSAMSGKIRDSYIVSEILKLWGEGRNIFIVYGSGHAIVQEPALKELLK